MANDGTIKGSATVQAFPGAGLASQPSAGGSSGGGGGGGAAANRAAKKALRIPAENESHTARMAAIAERFEADSTIWDNALDRNSQIYNRILGQVDREPRYSSGWFYWPFMTAIAVCESPVNRLSFELFFQESQVITYGVALLVGVIFVVLAHAIGMVTRRFRYSAEKAGGAIVAIGQLAIMIAFVVSLSYGVAVFRQGYLSFVTTPDPGFADLLKNQKFGEAAVVALKGGLGVEGWVFWIVNLAIVCVGIVAAFFCHDPHPDYEQADKRKNRAQKQIDKLAAQRARQELRERRRHEAEIHRLSI